MSDNNFGTNQDSTPTRTKGKASESFGIMTYELPNGQRIDGYGLVTVKNAEKLGISSSKLQELAKAQAKAVIGQEGGVRIHIQFGDRAPTVAAPVEMTFV